MNGVRLHGCSSAPVQTTWKAALDVEEELERNVNYLVHENWKFKWVRNTNCSSIRLVKHINTEKL